jgi:hypothetical protein
MRHLPIIVASVVFVCTASASSLSPFPLASVVNDARAYAAAKSLVNPTGLSRSDYLTTIHGIVSFFRPYQAANGSIVDPYAHEEIQV